MHYLCNVFFMVLDLRLIKKIEVAARLPFLVFTDKREFYSKEDKVKKIRLYARVLTVHGFATAAAFK